MSKKSRTKILVCSLFVIGVVLILAGSFVWKHFSGTKEVPVRAMYLPLGEDAHLMVDQESGAVFTVSMPDKIYDQKGTLITKKDLKRGNILNIYGDGIMLESYPGQYPGVTKIQVAEEGNPSDADPYQELLDQIWQKKDASEIPYLNVEYTTSLAVVSAVTMEGSYRWTYTAENGEEEKLAADTDLLALWEELPVMNVEGDTDLTLYFDVLPERVDAVRYSLEALNTEQKGEITELRKEGETYQLAAAQKGFLYLIQAEWENGQVEYGFCVE